jgi:type IV pilus assembly protein PilA
MINRMNKALAASKAARKDGDKGFTLIELLVVVLIIGILSAIAIPIFLGQQNQAKDASAKSDLTSMKTAIISYQTAHNGVYPSDHVYGAAASAAEDAELESYGASQSGNTTTIEIKSVPTDAAGILCVEATSNVPTTFHITDTGGVQDGGC